MRKITAFIVCLWAFTNAFAGSVDSLLVHSAAMNKDIHVMVVSPTINKTNKNARFPVVYLLHGHGGNYRTWINIKPELPNIADAKQMIFVSLSADNSWYIDSERLENSKYETFVSKELVQYIDQKYPAKAQREARAITGLSMGGHGGLFLAIRHLDTFGACGSMSGGVDIRPFPQNWNLKNILGEMSGNKKVWDNHTVINQIEKINNNDLAIIIDCGEDDFFLEVNKELHQRMLGRKINHDFITRPGGHTGDYWRNAIDYQLLFFEKYFTDKGTAFVPQQKK